MGVDRPDRTNKGLGVYKLGAQRPNFYDQICHKSTLKARVLVSHLAT